MHSDAHGPQVAYTHDTANDISTKVVEYEHLPDRVAIGVQYGSNWRMKCARLLSGLIGFHYFVEVEDFLERGCKLGLVAIWETQRVRRLPVWRSRSELPLEAIITTWLSSEEASRRRWGVGNRGYDRSKAREEVDRNKVE